MQEAFELVLRFLFGIAGALVIIFLRVFDQLPRMSTSTDIIMKRAEIRDLHSRWEEIHNDLKIAQGKMSQEMGRSEESTEAAETKVKQFKVLCDSYEVSLNDLSRRVQETERIVDRLRHRQWVISATLFALLGGVFSIFIPDLVGSTPIIADGSLNGASVFFSMLVGATWTTYLSFFEQRLSEDKIMAEKDRTIDELSTTLQQKVSEANELFQLFQEFIEDIKESKDKYEAVLDEYGIGEDVDGE